MPKQNLFVVTAFDIDDPLCSVRTPPSFMVQLEQLLLDPSHKEVPVKVHVFRGSLFTPLAFGINTIRRYGKPGVALLAIFFVVMWLILVSIFGLLDKTAQIGLRYPDILGVVMVHIVFVLWALYVAVCMVPRIIAIFRRNGQRRFSQPRLSA